MNKKKINHQRSWMLMTFGLLTLSVVTMSGCSQSQSGKDAANSGAAGTKVDQSVGGWWCVEHGVPEEECALCEKSLVAKFKEKGDWCKEHDRPESTCFICGPARFDKFAARYEAKTGQKPPKPTE